ncbi:MAG: glyoxalase [Alkalinema sp. RU_4_3]|nr:glyoxalase [Alkalinema sp. RU_4_3]
MSLIPTASSTVFHLAFPVGNLEETKAFYIEGLGAISGRESPGALILNLYGTQLVAHVTREIETPQRGIYPRHFGVVFGALQDWQDLCDRAQAKRLTFYQEARVRFGGEPLEHRTFFLADPFGNLLEFKHYARPEAVFGMVGVGKIGDA